MMTKNELNSNFPAINFEYLKNYMPDPADIIAGNGLIRKGASTLLAGPTGVGKSVLALQAGICCATGYPFLGIPISKPVKVLVIEAENDPATLKRDILSIANAMNVDENLLSQNLSIRHLWDTVDFEQRIRMFIEMEKPDLVIIDPYQAYVENDINNSATFSAFSIAISKIINDFRVALLLVAHFPKPKEVQKVGREAVYSVAGSAALCNWVRTSISLYPTKDSDQLYQLVFSKNAERAGLKDDDGKLIREIMIRHSGEVENPFWTRIYD
ncbi:MAG: AAA family ATPase [Kiritimatiellales bacterium]